MKMNSDMELENSILPVYALVRGIIYSDYERKSAHFTKTQIAVLAMLCWKNEMCMSQIAEYISVPRAQMTRTISSLVESGLVERFEDKRNRKMVHIRLTEEGRMFIRNYLGGRCELLKARLSEEDMGRLLEAAKTISEILNEYR